MGGVAKIIADKLGAAFSPTRLEVTDDSALHAGHAGAREGGESHFTVAIESSAFEGLARVARQRLVYLALAEELAGPVHALSLTVSAPGDQRTPH